MSLKKSQGSEKIQIDLMVNNQVSPLHTAVSAGEKKCHCLGLSSLHCQLPICNVLVLQPVEPGEVFQDAASDGADAEVDVDVGVVFNASVTKGEQTLV